MGGLFTGTPDGKYPGLATLKENGELQTMIDAVSSDANTEAVVQ